MKNIIKIIIPCFILFAISSCLKDKDFDDQKYGMDANGGGQFITMLKSYEKDGNNVIGILTSPVEEEFNYFTLTITDKPVAQDVQVTLQLLPSLIDEYNTANGTSFEPLPVSSYDLPLTVTIPKDERFVAVNLKLKKGPLDATKAYALGVQITGTSDASIKLPSNGKKSLISFLIKNKYDGNYDMTFKTVGWDAYGISDNLPATWASNADGTSIGMVTVGASSVKLFDYYAFGAFIQPAFTTGNGTETGFGNTAPKFTFDLATDKLTSVVNDVIPDSRNRAFRVNPAVTDNRFDPATKTIYAAYIMSQNGRPDQFIYDTLVYKGQRP